MNNMKIKFSILTSSNMLSHTIHRIRGGHGPGGPRAGAGRAGPGRAGPENPGPRAVRAETGLKIFI